MDFTCATPETGLSAFAISTGDVALGNNTMRNDVVLPNGDRQLTLSFIAPSEHQLINIACTASRITAMGNMLVDFNTSTALLMIQGIRLHAYIYTVDSITVHSLVVGFV